MFSSSLSFNIEAAIYLVVAVLSSSFRTVISGIKNGAFYGKGNEEKWDTGRVHKYIENLHRAENPAYWSQFFMMFFLLMALIRTGGFHPGLAMLISAAVAYGASAIAGPFRQGYINEGSGYKFVDTTGEADKNKSEFTLPIKINGKYLSIWWKRPWYGWNRYYFAAIWLIILIAIVAFLSFTI